VSQLALFADAPDEYTRLIAASGIAHFRDQLRRYSAQWGYLVPYWTAMIARFERMAAFGYDQAGPMPEHPDVAQGGAA
jgi:hypothetical protein